MRATKIRIYPNKEQEELINKTIGCCRYVCNNGLAQKIFLWESEKKSISVYELMKRLTLMKKEFSWLSEVDSVSLQQSLNDLEVAYKNFFRKHNGFPKFHKKGVKDSYRTIKVSIVSSFVIKLPKLGKIKTAERISKHKKIRSATICKEAGKYYVSLLYDWKAPIIKKEDVKVGIDAGIKTFAVLSNGIEYKNIKVLKGKEKRLKTLQRRLSKKQRRSKNCEKARLKLSRLHKRIANIRKDYLHKISTAIAKQYSFVAIEDLNVKGMLKNHKLAKSITDCSWSMFFDMLSYKSKWYGCELVKIGRFEPSSKMCNNCGCIMDKMPLNVREWKCPHCGYYNDRDLNAAKNILKIALSGRQGESVEMSSLDESMKQKNL